MCMCVSLAARAALRGGRGEARRRLGRPPEGARTGRDMHTYVSIYLSIYPSIYLSIIITIIIVMSSGARTGRDYNYY